MPITLNGDTGIQTPMYNGTITANAVTPSVNMKNRIINGQMVIDQRNAGASVSFAASATGYSLDRLFCYNGTDGAFTAQQSSTAPVGFTNSALITITTADTSLAATQVAYISQPIEGFNTADLGWGTANAKTVTLSFWVRSSLTGTFGGAVSNSAYNRSYPFSFTISSANTFEFKTITIAGDTTGTWLTNNGIGIRLTFGLGSGSTNAGTAGSWAAAGYVSATGATSVVGTNGATFQFTGVQLEVGSTATSFDYRPYGTELALCQRYYEVSTSDFSNPLFSGNVTSSVGYYANAVFKVTKRANPTVTLTNSFASNFPSTSGTAASISPESFYEPRTANGTGGGYFSSTFKASAEL